jgi:hypothetical protein
MVLLLPLPLPLGEDLPPSEKDEKGEYALG